MALSKLGRSFSELIESNKEEGSEDSAHVSVERLVPNPHQPRRQFDEATIAELAASIQAHGLLQPLVAIRRENHYELVAGERRFRALKRLGWTHAPVRLVKIDASGSLQAALIENLQREDLNAIECARAYRELITRFGLTQSHLAERLGRDRSTLANTLRLLELPEKIQGLVAGGALSAGHARTLLACKSPSEMAVMAEKIIRDGLSVRAVEEWVQKDPGKNDKKNQRSEDPNVAAAARELTAALGTKVRVQTRGGQRGRIVIEYYNLDDYQRLKERFLGSSH